jgi:hypothetical protein
MAWKQVDIVIELSEQKCMEADPQYGQAVLHLRQRCCDLHDFQLFNSRILKSSLNHCKPKTPGLSMG